MGKGNSSDENDRLSKMGFKREESTKASFLDTLNNILSTDLSDKEKVFEIDKRLFLVSSRVTIQASKGDKNFNKIFYKLCEIGALEAVKLALSQNQVIQYCITDSKNNYESSTPLHGACKNGQLDIAKILISNQDAILCKNKDGDHVKLIDCKNAQDVAPIELAISSKEAQSFIKLFRKSNANLACLDGKDINPKSSIAKATTDKKKGSTCTIL